MKNAILIFVILFVNSCKDKTDCFECYLNQFPNEQKIMINELHIEFESFLKYNYPDNKTTQERLKQYCVNISQSGFEEKIDTTQVSKLLFDYRKSGIEKEFRNWSSNEIFLNGLYFQAQRNCLEYDYQDSLIYNYILTYDTQGDLSPSRLVEYIANEADYKSLERKILEHYFIMEYFIPRMINKITLPNSKS